MKNLVVAKYINEELIKGFTRDFSTKEDIFHIVIDGKTPQVITIELAKLKAVFFVKTTKGDSTYCSDEHGEIRKMYGKPMEVEFYDGETIRGYAQVFHPRDMGFFMFPADKNSNNERIYIVRRAARSIRSLPEGF